MSLTQDLAKARSTLESLRKTQLRLDLTAWLGYALAWMLLLWLAAAGLETIFRLPTTARGWLLAAIILAVVGGFIYAWLRVKRAPHLRPGRTAEEWWALTLGRSAPDTVRDRLLNAIQINRPRPGARDQCSTELASEALYHVVAELKDVPLDKAIKRADRNKALRIVLIAVLITIGVTIAAPSSIINASVRLMHPGRIYHTPPPFTLSINPAGGWTYRGEPVSFTIRAEGQPPSDVQFIHRYEGGQPQKDQVQLKDGLGDIDFDGFAAPIIYSARGDGITTPDYHMEVVARPQIARLQYRLFPPRYTHLPVEIGPENVGDLEALPGSRLELTVRVTKPLSAAWFVFQRSGADSTTADSLPFDVTGQTGLVRNRLSREGSYQVRLRDEGGHSDRDPVAHRIRLLVDEPPLVRIIFPETDVDLGEDMLLPLQIEADDDYGIARLDLNFRRLDRDSTAAAVPLNIDAPGSRTIQAGTMWDLGELELFPGDVIEYWVVAWDNDNIRGPKRAESERRLVRLPSIEEIIAGVEQSEQQGLEQAEQTLETARELRERVSEIIEEMKRNPEQDWDRRRQMEQTLQKQGELERQVGELTERLDDLVQRLEKHDLTAAETLEKYRELQKLLAEVATPELREAMEKLRRAIEAQDPEQLRRALEQFDLNREQFLQSIERSLDILRQLQLERRMDELVKRSGELLHRQEDILDLIDSSMTDEMATQQQALARSMEMLENSLLEVKELAEQSGERELAADLDSLADVLNAKDIPADMRQASQTLSEGRLDQARSIGEQSARDLAELSQGLTTAADQLKERRRADLARKLRRLAEELLYVSTSQEELAATSIHLGTQSPRYRSLAGQQVDLQVALEAITSRLFEVAHETFFITPDLAASLGKASAELGRALDGFSGRNPRSVATPQKRALGEINRSARQLLNILEQLEGASSSSGFEEMMQQLAEMAGSQQGVNQQSMPLPGGEGEQMMPGDEGRFARLAAQQRALQEQAEQLAEDTRGMKELLGDLDEIAGSMGQVAEDLEDRNIDERTRRLQRQIVSRLLDATRSVREREYSRRRESRVGVKLTRRSPPTLKLDTDLQRLRRDLLRALQEGYTRDYRRLIRDYFQALESSAAE